MLQGLDWDLHPDDLLRRSRRPVKVQVRRRVGIVLVAAAIIVVFFVPLPHLSLLNRLTSQNGTIARTGSTVPPGSTMARVTPTAATGAAGYFWLVGTYPCSSGTCHAVMRSTDGGASFVTVGSLPASVDSLTFANRQDGYAFTLGDKPSVFWTGDGGATWRRVQVRDALDGLVTAGGYAYALTCVPVLSNCSSSPPSYHLDVSPIGEEDWTTMALPKLTEGQTVGLSASGSMLWLTVTPGGGGEARLLASSDRGRTFSKVTSKGLGGLWSLAVATSPQVLWGETVSSDMAGLSRSVDGGKTFVAFPEDAAGQSFTMGAEIFPLSDTEEVVVDLADSGFWRTENGGHSFMRMLGNRGIFDVGFATSSNWIALGKSPPTAVTSAKPTIWRTDNGGQAWQSLKPPETAALLPSVDLSATPKGWIPVDYGDAQISVPPSWGVLYHPPECGHTEGFRGVVLVDPRPNHCVPPPPQEEPTNEIELFPYAPGNLAKQPRLINGIPVYAMGSNWYDVPSLGISVYFDGNLGGRVLNTLTRSPRDVVLGPSGPSTAPPSWQRLSFSGVQVSAPSSWPVTRTDWGECGQSVLSIPALAVTFSNDIHAPPCAFTAGKTPLVERPSNGLRIDVGPQAVAPASVATKCLDLNGLRACPATDSPYSVLVLKVAVPGRSTPLIVSIGLAGNGAIARTILYSLRPASANGGQSTVVMPNLIFMTEGKALQKLRGLDLLAKTVAVASQIKPGEVVAQSPVAGATVPGGTTVVLKIASTKNASTTSQPKTSVVTPKQIEAFVASAAAALHKPFVATYEITEPVNGGESTSRAQVAQISYPTHFMYRSSVGVRALFVGPTPSPRNLGTSGVYSCDYYRGRWSCDLMGLGNAPSMLMGDYPPNGMVGGLQGLASEASAVAYDTVIAGMRMSCLRFGSGRPPYGGTVCLAARGVIGYESSQFPTNPEFQGTATLRKLSFHVTPADITLPVTVSVPRCRPGNLTVSAHRGYGSYGNEAVVVDFYNVNTHACEMKGYPRAWFVGSHGERIGMRSGERSAPAPSIVVLKPGQTASTTVWTLNPGLYEPNALADCQPTKVAGVRVTPPSQIGSLFTPISLPEGSSSPIEVCTVNTRLTTTPVVAGSAQGSP